ncbi:MULTISPECIES: AEC family transporter [Gordonibacter]|uniref:AEC family transporter n=1 Tax=Gordonibacter faecis TaxID=3047475 RepID=A0ABT7DNR2_9ACTN|nr:MULTISPECIES: AEC family transporter [unclassified Gordonibacter]MDJ1651037.1 AEC family transporter [Gordonibacter sp. KGMB12511]HIW77264.1 AEC family transporter [Candidatus Gordonibacter avicola]
MIFDIVLNQMIVFFLVLLTGAAASKLGVIRKDYLPDFAKLISKVLLPVMLFFLTYSRSTRETVFENLPMIGLAAAFYVVIIAVTWVLAKILRPVGDKAKVFRFAFIFGNTGFVGIPLLAALFPDSGPLYLALFSIIDQALFWTYGIYLATASGTKARINAKSFVNPNLIAMALAFAFVLIGIPLPGVVCDTLGLIANGTSAMCMLYLGALCYFSNLKDALRSKELYAGIAVKMIALPVAAGWLLKATPLDPTMTTSLVLLMALPTMTVVPMIAKMHGTEGDYAAGLTVGTLVASVVTIPLVALLAL